MNRTLTIMMAFCVVLAATPARAQFGFGKPSLPSAPTGGGGATPADIDKFLKDAADADALVQTSSFHLLKAVASKEKVAEIKAKMDAANQISDPKEKQAKLDAVQAEIQTELQKADYAKANEELKAQHDAKKNEAVGWGIYHLTLGSLKDVELVATGKKLVSGVPSPTVAGKIPDVKDALARLVNQGDGLTKVVGSAKSLMSTVGLKALPASASEAPKPAPGD